MQTAAAQNTPPDKKPVERLLYIDNIRVFLTILVIAHHLMIIYTHSGGWIYYDGRQDDISNALGGWFCTINQSYFMGLFLLISAYFIPGSYQRKGAGKFLKDRLIRLGIPLVVYCWLVRPVFLYYGMGVSKVGPNYWTWFRMTYLKVNSWIGGGPTWFIEILLLFSILYVLARLVIRSKAEEQTKEWGFPGSWAIVLFAVLLALATFIMRLWFPVNTVFVPLNLQFANIAQYIALFVMGLIAYHRGWFSNLPNPTGKRWLWISVALMLIYPVLAVATGGIDNPEPFMGGLHWQSFLLTLWESFMCVGACIGLVYIFRHRLNRQNRLASILSQNAYAAYLIHEPVITLLAIAVAGILVYPLLKFGLALLIFTPICFGISILVRKIPYVDRAL